MQICSNEIKEKYFFIIMDFYCIFLLLNNDMQYFLVAYGKGYFGKIISNAYMNIFWYILLRRFLKYVMTRLQYFMSFHKWVICPDKKFSYRMNIELYLDLNYTGQNHWQSH